MDFSDYYKNKSVVESYDTKRMRGIKAGIVRMLEREYVNILTEYENNKSIFEIGVGTGFISQLLIKKGKFMGMDISPEMIAAAKKNLKKTAKKIKLIKGNILKPKIKNKFDKIVSIRVISHFDKNRAILALNNVRSLLKDGGQFIFNIENKSIIRKFARVLCGWGSTYNYQYSDKDIWELLSKTHFKAEKIIYMDHLFMLPLHMLNLILFKSLDKTIFELELKMKHIRFSSNNSFIRCKKQ